MNASRTGAGACAVCVIVWLAACKDEFPNAPLVAVSIDAASWRDTVSVSDVDTLQISVTRVGGGDITGVQVHWESSNPAKLGVTPLQPADSLMLQLQTVITAHARDTGVIVTATVDRPGFERETFSRKITVMERWIAVSAGYDHSCGVTVDGSAYCWGTGLLGNGSTAGSRLPVQVLGQLAIKSVTAGNGQSCAALVDGRAYCWGLNLAGAIGNGLPGDQLTPVPVSLGRTFQSVVAGQDYVCGLTTDATGFCWGDNASWQLGDGGLVGLRPTPSFDDCGFLTPNLCSLRPRPIQNRSRQALPLLSVAPRVLHTCAVLTSRAAICWGHGSKELGSNVVVTTDSTAPLVEPVVNVPGSLSFSSVTVGRLSSCGITYPQRQVYCWGFNAHGELGGASADTSFPVAVSGPVRAYVSTASGDNSTCGIASDSTVYCWGSNEFGQLGTTGTTGACSGVNCSRTPLKVQLPNNPKIISLSVGVKHACAVVSRGAAYCWGEASGGKLGNDSVPDSPILTNPVRVSEPR